MIYEEDTDFFCSRVATQHMANLDQDSQRKATKNTKNHEECFYSPQRERSFAEDLFVGV